jgi:hypothetical protein
MRLDLAVHRQVVVEQPGRTPLPFSGHKGNGNRGGVVLRLYALPRSPEGDHPSACQRLTDVVNMPTRGKDSFLALG